jgi:hypothetical protein
MLRRPSNLHECIMNSSNPKMSVMPLKDRTNFMAWREAILSCAMQKGAKGALDAPMPDTAGAAAVCSSNVHDEVSQTVGRALLHWRTQY